MIYEEGSARAQSAGLRSVPGRATDESRTEDSHLELDRGPAPLPVLLITARQLFAERLRKGLAGSHEIKLIVRAAPHTKTPLAHLAANSGARLIIVDADLFTSGVLGLSFQANPEEDGPELMLVFDKVAEPAVQLSLLSRAHGCLEFSVTTEDFARAIDAVVNGGELWFPRWMMEPFYDMALAAMVSAGGQAEAASALTEREIEVMRLVQRGLTNKQAAERLGISPNTVKKHLHNALLKRGIQRRRQLFG